MAAWRLFVARLLPRSFSSKRQVLWAVLGVIAATGVRPTPSARPMAPLATSVAQSYYFLPEVRLRKFHLVRPDLIPYPITYEVYC